MTNQESLERAFDLRGTPANTRSTYRRCIGRFERFAGRCADQIGRPDVEQFLLHLVRGGKVSPSTHNVYVGALKFLYDVVVERPEVMASMPRRKQPMRLPCRAAAPSKGTRGTRAIAYWLCGAPHKSTSSGSYPSRRLAESCSSTCSLPDTSAAPPS